MGSNTYDVKSVVISRKPIHDKEESWSAFIGLFTENNPHLKGKEPFKIIEVKEIEKVRIRELRNISYYLQGNDIVINNLKNITISEEKGIVIVTGKQDLPK